MVLGIAHAVPLICKVYKAQSSLDLSVMEVSNCSLQCGHVFFPVLLSVFWYDWDM